MTYENFNISELTRKEFSAEVFSSASIFGNAVSSLQLTISSQTIQALQTLDIVLSSGEALTGDFLPVGFHAEHLSCSEFIGKLNLLILLIENKSWAEVQFTSMSLISTNPTFCISQHENTFKLTVQSIRAAITELMVIQNNIIIKTEGNFYICYEIISRIYPNSNNQSEN